LVGASGGVSGHGNGADIHDHLPFDPAIGGTLAKGGHTVVLAADDALPGEQVNKGRVGTLDRPQGAPVEGQVQLLARGHLALP